MNLKEIIDSGVLEEYVLGTLPEKEAEEITRLCAEHPELASEVEAIEHTLLNSFSIPVKTEWKKDILDAMKEPAVHLHKEEPAHDAKIIPINGSAGKENGGARKWFLAAASFALLFALSAAANFYLLNQNQNLSEELTEVKVKLIDETEEKTVFAANYKQSQDAYAALFNPDFKRVEMQRLATDKPLPPSVLYWNDKTGEVVWDGSTLPKLSAGEQYQLWAIVDGKPQDGGMHTADKPTRMKNAFSAQAFAVTVEPTGGSAAPTMDRMVVYAPIKTVVI